MVSLVAQTGSESACSVGDLGSIPGWGRSGERNSNPLLYSCLENSMDGRAWQATIHGVAKSRTGLNDSLSLFHYFSFLGELREKTCIKRRATSPEPRFRNLSFQAKLGLSVFVIVTVLTVTRQKHLISKYCIFNILNNGFSRLGSEVRSLSRVRLFATLWTVATRLICPWGFPSKSTGVGCHVLLQGIFLTQGLSLGLPHCRQPLYCLSH